jgi:DNA primase catalytic subunit
MVSGEIEKIREYYESLPPNGLTFPPYTNHRLFQVRCFSGKWIIIRDTIRTPEILLKHLINIAPKDVYFSTSRWLSPTTLTTKPNRGKHQNKIADNCFLGSEFYVDIDIGKKLKTKEEAFSMTWKIIDFLKSKGFSKILLFTTGRGFHLHVRDFEQVYILKYPKHPFNREYYYSIRKRKLVAEMKNKGLIFDEPISVDTRRIIRLPGTIHGSTMSIVHALPLNARESSDDDVSLRHKWEVVKKPDTAWSCEEGSTSQSFLTGDRRQGMTNYAVLLAHMVNRID